MKPIVPSFTSAVPAAARQTARKVLRVGIIALAVGFLGTAMLFPTTGSAQEPRNVKAMEALKAETAKLGTPKIEGSDPVGAKDAPALYFGSIKMNNNFAIVDKVAKEGGDGMAATLFVKRGDEYIRVTTNVMNPDGSGRAIGTVMGGPALDSIKAGKPYFGDVQVLGTRYFGYYEPIKDGSGAIVGAYFVGYKK
jgi:Cache 3/Cache 2 fusion domain